MILYRALTDIDLCEFKNTGKINSLLVRSFVNLDNNNLSRTKEFYNECFNKKNSIESRKIFLFRLVYGHVRGKLCDAQRSPWISLTSSFKVAYEYATLKKYIKTDKKRCIIAFEVENNLIFNSVNELINNEVGEGIIINFSNGKLLEYAENGLIKCFDSKEKQTNIRSSIANNYAKADKEYLACGQIIPKNYILLTPNEVEILNEETEEVINAVVKNKLEKQQENIKQLKLLKN